MAPHRWLLAVIRWLVPRPMRDDWTREWEAELDHRESTLRQWRAPTLRDRAGLIGRTAGAAWDALWLRTSRWQTLRALVRHRRVSIPVVFSLAAALAATITAAGLYDALLVRPPGIRDPGRVLTLYVSAPNSEDSVSPDDARYYRERSRAFSDLTAFTSGVTTMAAPDLQQRLVGVGIAENYFDLLGVTPRLGRLLFPSGPGASHDLVVLSESLWRRLGADPHIVGRPFRLEHATFTVLGVAPASFAGMNWVFQTDVWYPFAASARIDGRAETTPSRTDRGLYLLGRLAPGATAEQAQAEVAGLSAQLAAAFPETDKDRRAFLTPTTSIPASQRGWITPMLAALVGLALLTLVAAASNATNLLLGLAMSRRHEMLVRTALGASKLQLMSPLLRESLMLAAGAGLAGFGAAYAALAALSAHAVSIGPDYPAPSFDVRPGPMLAMLSAMAVIVVGIGVGLAPAWRAAADGLSNALNRELMTAGTRRNRLRNILVVLQTTVATVVLVGVGVSWRSAVNLRHVDLGFSARHLVTAVTSLDLSSHTVRAANEVHDQLRAAMAAIPGVEAVSQSTLVPVSSCCEHDMIRNEDGAESSRTSMPYVVVDDGFFPAVGIAVLSGRTFAIQDQPGAPEVIVVNQHLARSRWPNQDPIGRRLRIENGDRLVTVIGVVADSRYGSVDEAPKPLMFFGLRQHPRASVNTIFRTTANPRAIRRLIRQAVAAFDPNLQIFSLRTLQEDLDLNLLLPDLIVGGLTGLGALALVLTAVGLYGIVFYSVGQRRREIGIRIALGASASDVVRMVLSHALKLGLAGAAAGLAISQLILPLVAAAFYGIRPVEAGILAIVGAFSLAVTLSVAFVAARPWTRASAVEILRAP